MTKRKTMEQRRRAREWERNKWNIIGIWTLNVIGGGVIIFMGLVEAGII